MKKKTVVKRAKNIVVTNEVKIERSIKWLVFCEPDCTVNNIEVPYHYAQDIIAIWQLEIIVKNSSYVLS